ncbi:hypothetical protein BH18ACT15_BH18ACT15_05810 [soil metagenome]
MLSMGACLTIAGYAVLQAAIAGGAIGVALWFVGAAVGHDLVLFPLYTLTYRLAGGTHRKMPLGVEWFNHLRFPVVISGLLLLVYAPLVLGFSASTYSGITGLSASIYLAQWLLATGILFALSGAVYALRLGRAARRESP